VLVAQVAKESVLRKDYATATHAQLRSPGQTGDLGQAAQKAVGVEGQTDIARARAVRLVEEIGVKQNGATPTHAQKPLFLNGAKNKD